MKERYQQERARYNRALAQLDPLVGTWRMVGVHPAFVSEAKGVAVFEWLLDGGLLLWRFTWEDPGPPSATAVIGRDDSAKRCSMLYADERGVTRVYQMSVEGNLWTMWRDAPGFSQQMTGRISDDGTIIEVLGKLSRDGSTWERDLDVTYTKMAD